MPFLFLLLPAELRLRIYDYMLNPSSTRTDSSTRTRINWMGYSTTCPTFSRGKGHEVDSPVCTCKRSGSPWLPGPPSDLAPAVLATCRFVYEEALPRLYEGRTFEAVNFRTFGTQHEAFLERWWILDCFLASLSTDARQRVKSIKVPLLLSGFETYGCAEAFRSIQSRTPKLRLVEVQLLIQGILEWGSNTGTASVRNGNAGLWPLMVFDEAEVRFGPPNSPQAVVTDGVVDPSEDIFQTQQRKMDAMRATRRLRARARSEKKHLLLSEEVEGVAGFEMLWED